MNDEIITSKPNCSCNICNIKREQRVNIQSSIMNDELNEQVLQYIAEESKSKQNFAKVKFKLICASKCKKFALDFAADNRGHKWTRVGQDFLIACEANLKNFIHNRVKTHPSKGKTLM